MPGPTSIVCIVGEHYLCDDCLDCDCSCHDVVKRDWDAKQVAAKKEIADEEAIDGTHMP